MTDIAITNLTNSTDTVAGTGVFDLLITAVERQINAQYDAGRITGTDYATVYLGGLQAVLQQSVAFLMQEQEAGLKADALQSQLEDSRNKAQAELEKQWGYAVTRDGVTGDNVLGNSTGTGEQDYKNQQVQDQTDGVIGQTAETYAKIALLDQQQISELAKTTNPTGGLLKSQQDEVLADTVRSDSESAQKVLLMTAQTLGFQSDTKQKILKQMLDGYAVNLSIAGTAGVPETTKDAAIDQLSQEILDDVTTSVVIQSVAQTPDDGSTDNAPT